MDRTCAHRTTAGGTGRPLGIQSPWTRPRATSASVASSARPDGPADVDELLAAFARSAAVLIEGAAVVVVAAASVDAFARVVVTVAKRVVTHGERKAIWHRYGMWLLLGLEFELAADIIRTVVSPSWQDLGELGAIAVIRTFINFFLEKDLATVSRQVNA